MKVTNMLKISIVNFIIVMEILWQYCKRDSAAQQGIQLSLRTWDPFLESLGYQRPLKAIFVYIQDRG